MGYFISENIFTRAKGGADFAWYDFQVLVLLGTDSNQFLKVLDRLLQHQPDSPWVQEIRRQLTPETSSKGLLDMVKEELESERVQDVTKPRHLRTLMEKLTGQPELLHQRMRGLVYDLLLDEGVIDEEDRAELNAYVGDSEA